MIVQKVEETSNPLKKSTSVLVTSLINNLDNKRSNLYSSKQTKKIIKETIINSGIKQDLKLKYINKLEKLLNKGINQSEVIGSIIYSIKEDFNILKENDNEITELKIDTE